jgi:hypothetical protein
MRRTDHRTADQNPNMAAEYAGQAEQIIGAAENRRGSMAADHEGYAERINRAADHR